jgi:hypothetical protein
MSENDDPFSPAVVLGFDAAWGFAPADQTSPALAAAGGALVDATMTDQPVTELRIHGVSGSDGPTMLEHPAALQVAGDGVTGFYRRWSPDGGGRLSVPWKLEAYSWGGLTEKPLASASWLLLAPFMMYNVAYFMLPPEQSAGVVAEPVPHLRRGRGHSIAGMLLRLLALAATVQFVGAVALVALSTVAWQAAGRAGMLPSWMGWYGDWTAGWRVALALAAVAVIIAALWWVSVTTASKYETRTSTARAHLNAVWPLTQPGFWKGQVLVGRQRAVHAAAACASAALIAALPAERPAAARWVAVILAAVALAAAAYLIVSPMTSRHEVTVARGGMPEGSRAGGWCWGVLAVAVAALITAAVVSGWTDRRHGSQTGALPGLTGFLAVLLAVQAALLLMLAVTVVVLARRAAAPGGKERTPPYLGGGLAALIAVLGFSLGGLLSAIISIGVTRLLGTPVPSGFRFAIAPSDALAVPWPTYVFAGALAGMLAGAVAAAILLFVRYRRRCAGFQARTGAEPSDVAADYDASTAGRAGPEGDDAAYARHRASIAKAWAVALVTDDAPVVTALAVGGGIIVVLAAAIAAAVRAGPAGHPALLAGWWHGLATLTALVGILLAGWLITLLRQAYTDPARRKTIGALWDVATFWPRAVHPLAPPCYAERAVPEVVDRIRLLTGYPGSEPNDASHLHAQAGQPDLPRTRGLTVPPGPLLLTGYSQGSVIAPAVVAQLPAEVLPHVALLTLACPARRLYGRAFPAYFGWPQLDALARLLDATTAPDQPSAAGQPQGRWKNLRRRSDYIGSWIFAEPRPRLSEVDLQVNIDQPCWDPVILVQDANPTPPPTHRHSQWWQDPRTNEVGAHLVRLLAGRNHDLPGGRPRAASGVPEAQPPVMIATGQHQSTGRDEASGTTSRTGLRPGRRVARRMIAVGSAVIVGAATGTAAALAGVGTAIAAEVAAGVVVGGGVAVIAALEFSAAGRARRRDVASPRESGRASAQTWSEAVSAALPDDGDDGNGGANGNGNGNEAPSGGLALEVPATVQAYPRLDAPDEVAPGEEFIVTTGLRSDADGALVSTGAMDLQSDEKLEVALQFDPVAFMLVSPSSTATVQRTPDDLWPSTTFQLIARANETLRAERRIDVKFLREGQLVGFASRALMVRSPGALPPDSPITSSSSAGPSAARTEDLAAARLDLREYLDEETDLLIFIRPSADLAGTRLVFTAHSRHADIVDRAESLSEELRGESKIGTTPQQIGQEARLKVASTDDERDLFDWLRGFGVRIFRSFPPEISAAVRAAVAKGTEGAPARILLFSEEPYVPWELAVDPDGWPSAAGTTAPFLGAHAAISRWVLGDVPPPKPRPVPTMDVRRKALVRAHYEGVVGLMQWGALPEAEAEVENLATFLAPGVEMVNPDLDDVLKLLDGTPAADLMHFALHGNFDPLGLQGGLVLLRMVNDKPVARFLQENHVIGKRLRQEPFVYLNACQVAAGNAATFGGYGGMAAAFLTAGARGVLAPLWNIKDGTASALAQEFYDLSSGEQRLPAAEILRRFRARYSPEAVRDREANVNATLIAFQLFGHPGLRLFPDAVRTAEMSHG